MKLEKDFPKGPVHLVGIGGYGMRGLARLFFQEGRKVTGSDAIENPSVSILQKEGIECVIGHSGKSIPEGTAFVVYSAAVPHNNPELENARRSSLPCFKYAEALGRFCMDKKVIACSGTHGKSTSTALMAFLLRQAGLNPGYLVGADPVPGMDWFKVNAAFGDPMVVEACEYDRSFLNFHPRGALITNIELEHVDCFPTEEELFSAFRTFVLGMEKEGVLAVPKNLERKLSLEPDNGKNGLRVVTFGCDGMWKIKRREVSFAKYNIVLQSPAGDEIKLCCPLPGRHNALNLVGVFVLSCELFGIDKIKSAIPFLHLFKGLFRRFEIKWQGQVVVVDDYAHHPTEILTTLETAREYFSGLHRLIVVFQPHQGLRLRTFADDFEDSFRSADYVIVTPVFSAREKGSDKNSDSMNFSTRLLKSGVDGEFCPDFKMASEHLLHVVTNGDVVVFLGAGDITKLASEFAAMIALREKKNG